MNRARLSGWPLALAAFLAAGHGYAVLLGMGGWSGLNSDWPIATHDHPIQFHSTTVTSTFLRQSWTTAGYDPSFMAGYAKSIIFPPSSTSGDVVAFLTGTTRPALTYKWTVFVSVAAIPWLVLAAGGALGLRPAERLVGVAVYLVYIWSDFPISYAEFGMQPYLLAIPLGLWAAAAVVPFLERGGAHRYLAACLGMSLAVLVHLTSAMVVAPAVALAYMPEWSSAPRKTRGGSRAFRHAGYWSIPAFVLALNAFWWWPGVKLASIKGDSGFAFTHSNESVAARLGQIVGLSGPIQPEIQVVLWALGVPGIVLLARRKAAAGLTLGGFAIAGFAWGYGAGATPALDFLQPGRHTYALYTALAVGAGVCVLETLRRLEASSPPLGRWAVVGLLLVGLRLFGPGLAGGVRERLALPGSAPGRRPFLSSAPTSRLRWVVDRVTRHVKPGERLLYEESGFGLPGLADPYQGGRFSGLLPYLTKVEILGGPYLHVALQTNFTQFGEGRLFGRADWDRAYFEEYAALYQPAAILCWTPRARAFCRDNPDLVHVVDDDGVLLLGRLRAKPGSEHWEAVAVEARPGSLLVRRRAAELDGPAILRYHFVPFLQSRPEARVRPVPRAADPVPFIGLEVPPEGSRLSVDLGP